ncbi:MAG: hypothetical protein O9294_17425 [Cytophagales bacterium]|jgi:hypothetical protein|nr:hypothetical protein [Cytophagales bacterium]
MKIRLVGIGFLACVVLLSSCKSQGETMVKPRYHHTWYKKHVYKKKWHIGRFWIRPEKQGVKKVRVKK